MVKELQYLKQLYVLTRSMAKGVGEGDSLKEVDRVQREAASMYDGSSSEEDEERPQAKPVVQEEADRVQREAETQPPDRRTKSRQPPSTGGNPDQTKRKR